MYVIDEDKIDECSKKGKVCNEETGRCKEKKEPAISA